MTGTEGAADDAAPFPDGMEVLAENPAFIRVIGNETQMIVTRSPVVRDDDPAYAPVREHAQRYGLKLASVETEPTDDWMFGQVRIEWFMAAA